MATTTADFIQERLRDPKRRKAFVRGLITARVLSYLPDALFHARRQNKLTQDDVAREMHTKQPSIARLEHDMSGSASMKRYLDFALACGQVPLTMLAPMDSVVEFMEAHPDATLGAEEYLRWRQCGSLGNDNERVLTRMATLFSTVSIATLARIDPRTFPKSLWLDNVSWDELFVRTDSLASSKFALPNEAASANQLASAGIAGSQLTRFGAGSTTSELEHSEPATRSHALLAS